MNSRFVTQVLSIWPVRMELLLVDFFGEFGLGEGFLVFIRDAYTADSNTTKKFYC